MNNLSSPIGYYMDCNGQIMFVQENQVYLVGNQLFQLDNGQQYLAQIPTLAQQQLLVPQSIPSSVILSQQETPFKFDSSLSSFQPQQQQIQQQQQQQQQQFQFEQEVVDELVSLTNILYQPAEIPCNNSSEVAEIAFDLQSSLPSSPKTDDSPLSPSLSSSSPSSSISSSSSSSNTSMFNTRHEQLPSIIDSLSEPIDTPHLAPFKKQFSFVPQQPQLPSLLPPIISPRLHHSSPRVSIPSPQSPSLSPPQSPKRSKKNYTKEFNMRFHDLLNHNEEAGNQWHLYSQKHKSKCTIKRSPCIKVSRGFCASYGQAKGNKEFTTLAKEERYGALGTRTECECGHKAAPLPSSSFSATSSSSSPHRKVRSSTRSTPYPSRCPSTPQELELPSSPQQEHSSSQDKWLSMLVQNASLIYESFNNLGGMQCTECKSRRMFTSRDEVTAYLMGDGVSCSSPACRGHCQLNVV